jgi:integrase
MAIEMCTDEKGKVFWHVYVSIKSKINRSVRAQRRARRVEGKREAERLEKQFFEECVRELAQKEAQGQSWKQLVDSWAEYLESDDNGLAETTKEDYVTALRNHTKAWFNRPAISITAMDVRELLGLFKADGKTVEFQKKFKNMLTRVFTFGMERRLIKGLDRAPTFGVKIDRPEEKKPEILTLAEIRQLLTLAKEYESPWYPIWAMALLTGMRNGELYALRWEDVNLESRIITVCRSYNKRLRETKSAKKEKGTKSGYWRTVPVSSELYELLIELKSETGDRPTVLPRPGKWQKGMQADELRKFLAMAGLPSVRFHALRACFATQLIRAGVPAIKLQKICGWRDLKTMQRYIRIAAIEVDGATEPIKLLPREEGGYHEIGRSELEALGTTLQIEKKAENEVA